MPDSQLVQRCPICEGRGVVAYPPNIPATQREFVSSSTGPWPCPYCKGALVAPAPTPRPQVTAEDISALRNGIKTAEDDADDLVFIPLFRARRILTVLRGEK